MPNFFIAALVLVVGMVSLQARAGDMQTIRIIYTKDHEFKLAPVEDPANAKVQDITGPANAKFKLIIENKSSTAEEFESHELNREKVIPPGGTATFFLGPLPAGTYPFFGEFHPKTAQGKLILK